MSNNDVSTGSVLSSRSSSMYSSTMSTDWTMYAEKNDSSTYRSFLNSKLLVGIWHKLSIQTLIFLDLRLSAINPLFVRIVTFVYEKRRPFCFNVLVITGAGWMSLFLIDEQCKDFTVAFRYGLLKATRIIKWKSEWRVTNVMKKFAVSEKIQSFNRHVLV